MKFYEFNIDNANSIIKDVIDNGEDNYEDWLFLKSNSNIILEAVTEYDFDLNEDKHIDCLCILYEHDMLEFEEDELVDFIISKFADVPVLDVYKRYMSCRGDLPGHHHTEWINGIEKRRLFASLVEFNIRESFSKLSFGDLIAGLKLADISKDLNLFISILEETKRDADYGHPFHRYGFARVQEILNLVSEDLSYEDNQEIANKMKESYYLEDFDDMMDYESVNSNLHSAEAKYYNEMIQKNPLYRHD